MAKPHHITRQVGAHPTYSQNQELQEAMKESVDAQFHSIMELVETVIHKRLTQFGEVLVEKKQLTSKEGG